LAGLILGENVLGLPIFSALHSQDMFSFGRSEEIREFLRGHRELAGLLLRASAQLRRCQH
jgi:hypothetical protein